MKSTLCLEALLFAFLFAGIVAENNGFFKTPVTRRQLTGGGSHSSSSSSSTSSSHESKSKSSSSSKDDDSKSSSSSSSDDSKSSNDDDSKSKPSSSSESKTKHSPSESVSKPSKPSHPSKSKPSSDGKGKGKGSGSSSGKGKGNSGSTSSGKGKGSSSSTDGSTSSGKGKGSSSSTDGSTSSGKGKGGKGKGGKGKGGKGAGKGKGAGGKGKGFGGRGPPDFAYEGEACGEDVNGGCDSDPPIYGSIKFGQTLIGEFGAVSVNRGANFQSFRSDSDWYLFDIERPVCVQASLESIHPGIVTLFEGFTFETDTCKTDLLNVASGDTSGEKAVYCFPEAGQYGVFVAPEFFDPTPCVGETFTYYLAIEEIECGECLIQSGNPGCINRSCERKVCREDQSCCDDSWSALCIEIARDVCDCADGDGNIIDEDEPCGEDINSGCFNEDQPIYSDIEFGQTILGEYGAEFDPDTDTFDEDSDWYLFEALKPGTCVRATLESIQSGDVVLFQGFTFDADTCTDNLVNVASGDSSGKPAVYCFEEAGEYGVFVAPTFSDKEPCEGDPNEYILTLENLGTCGTCLMESDSGGCVNTKCQSTVCEYDESCCESAWDAACVEKAKLWCECAGGKVPDIVEEGEACNEDINGGCTASPPVYSDIELGQTLLGEYGRDDTDWFLFQTENQGTCVQATLLSRETGDVILFEGATFDSRFCTDNLVNVASGDSSGIPAFYCFDEPGSYGVFVAPTFQDDTPCEGDPNTYVLSLEGLDCGNCFVPHGSHGCSNDKCEQLVCDYDKSCCNDDWDATCAEKAKLWCDCSVKKPSEDSKPSKPSKPSKSKKPSSDSGKGKGSVSSSGKGKGSYSRTSSGKGKGSYSSGKGKGGSSYESYSSSHSSYSRKKYGMMMMRYKMRKGMRGMKRYYRRPKGYKYYKDSKSKGSKSSKSKSSKRSKYAHYYNYW